MTLKTLTVNPNGKPMSVQLAARLTCLCPVNGKRDYATVEANYVPVAAVVELESFRAQLDAYATERIGHEDVTEAIADAIYDAAMPDDLTVRTRWEPVEGVECVVVAHR